jgi:hypothetical protein
VKAHRVDDKVMRLGLQGQKLVIRHNDHIGAEIGPHFRKTGHDRRGSKRSVNLDQSLFDVRSGNPVQEERVIVVRVTPGAGAVPGKSRSVG